MPTGLLEEVFTCNTDGLDHQLGLPDSKIVAVHGSRKLTRCEFCKHEMPSDKFRELLGSNIKDIYQIAGSNAPAESSVIACTNPACGKAGMRPATVLFDADLDADVLKHINKQRPANLLFVVGTSLSVTPASDIPSRSNAAVRVVVNLNSPVYEDFEFGNGRDHLLRGDCDEMFAALAARLGWLPDLARFRDTLPPASLATLDMALEAAK